MSLQRTLSLAALIAATFIFVDSASSQPRAPEKAPAAASAAEHKGMHGTTAKEREQHRKEMHDKMHGDKSGKEDHDCMMDKQKKQAAADDKSGRCGMGRKQS